MLDQDGKVVDHVKTSSDGAIISKTLPTGDYSVKETKAPEGYELSEKDYTVHLDYQHAKNGIVEVNVEDIPDTTSTTDTSDTTDTTSTTDTSDTTDTTSTTDTSDTTDTTSTTDTSDTTGTTSTTDTSDTTGTISTSNSTKNSVPKLPGKITSGSSGTSTSKKGNSTSKKSSGLKSPLASLLPQTGEKGGRILTFVGVVILGVVGWFVFKKKR
ncbi:prealbumin-like fold domain-containing protein [Pediococcus pentosaceus]|uniref:prealbumin-like fold domain-containing protein n=1 Tax=Pediococcus pentosaceus TaxID=1255 RepID=UPI003D16199E